MRVGVNVTVIVQLESFARDVPHELVCVKEELFAPVIVMLLIVSAVFALFVNVMFCGALEVPTV